MDQDVISQLREYIRETFPAGGEATELGLDDSLIDGGIIDSLGVLALVGFLEESFALEVVDEEMLPENFDSLRKLADFVRRKQLAQGL